MYARLILQFLTLRRRAITQTRVRLDIRVLLPLPHLLEQPIGGLADCLRVVYQLLEHVDKFAAHGEHGQARVKANPRFDSSWTVGVHRGDEILLMKVEERRQIGC